VAEPQVWPEVSSRPGTGRDGRAALFQVVFLVAFLVAFLVEGHNRASKAPNRSSPHQGIIGESEPLARFCGVGQASRCDSRSIPRTLTPTDASRMAVHTERTQGHLGCLCRFDPAAHIAGYGRDNLRVRDDPGLVWLVVLSTVQSTDEGCSCGHVRIGIGCGSGA